MTISDNAMAFTGYDVAGVALEVDERRQVVPSIVCFIGEPESMDHDTIL